MKIITVYDQGDLIAAMAENDDTADQVLTDLTDRINGDPTAELIEARIDPAQSLEEALGLLGLES